MTTATLTTEEQQRLRELFAKSAANTLEHDVQYLANLKDSFFDSRCASEVPAIRRLGQYGRWMQQLLFACHTGTHPLSTTTRNACTAVLLYLVNPFDMIPDKDAQRGHLDDLFMLELGLSQFGNELEAFVSSCSAPHD